MAMTTQLARTPLFAWHVAHGGRMVDFAGWEMPVQYSSITEEHQATRAAIGLFDISHMGRLRFFGPDAARFLDGSVTRRVMDMRPGQVRYGLVCNDRGGILDDVLVYRLAAGDEIGDETPTFQVVVNASNRAKIVDWFGRRLPDYATKMDDVTAATAMIAVQGPRAVRLVAPLVDCELATMRYYTGTNAHFDAHFAGGPCFISRTGYTGEDGCEIICPAASALAVWERLIAAGASYGLRPVGLGARDTLRLEAAMPLYGHELTEQINPIQAGLGFAVSFGEREFVGREALERFAKDASLPVRIGLQLDGKRVPRQGSAVLRGDEPIGEVTSGTFSPTFQRPIAMAYVQPSAQAPGSRLAVDVRGTSYPAVVVPLPFYERGRQV
jgi:glycine cleavage system T protein (aminomethyltransferase)